MFERTAVHVSSGTSATDAALALRGASVTVLSKSQAGARLQQVLRRHTLLAGERVDADKLLAGVRERSVGDLPSLRLHAAGVQNSRDPAGAA